MKLILGWVGSCRASTGHTGQLASEPGTPMPTVLGGFLWSHFTRALLLPHLDSQQQNVSSHYQLKYFKNAWLSPVSVTSSATTAWWEWFHCRTMYHEVTSLAIVRHWCVPLSWSYRDVVSSFHHLYIRKRVSLPCCLHGPGRGTYRGRAACCREPLPCAGPGRCRLRRRGLGLCTSGSSCNVHLHRSLSTLTRRTSKTTRHPLGRDTKSHRFWNPHLTHAMWLQRESALCECAVRATDHHRRGSGIFHLAFHIPPYASSVPPILSGNGSKHAKCKHEDDQGVHVHL